MRSPTHIGWAVCVLAGTLGGGFAIAAPPTETAAPPTASPPDLTELSLEQLMDLPVLSVVTAAKREQTTTQAPAQASVVTAADILQFGYRTLADILRASPGFYVTYDRGYGFIGVRGFGRPGDFGGRVLLLLDGHRMNDPLYDYAAVVSDFILDVDLIDRVEVVRGPGSALYGNNAFFAVVNVITKRASEFEPLQASAEAGTYDTYKGRLTYGARAANGTEWVLSATGYRSQGNPSVYFPEFDSPETANGVVQDGDDDAFGSTFGSVRWRGLAIEGGYIERDKTDPSPKYGTVFGATIETVDKRAVLEGRYEGAIREGLQAMARIYYDWYQFRGDYPYDVADSSAPAEIVINRDECESATVGSEVQLNWQASGRHNVSVGTEYRFDFRAQLRNYDVSPRTAYLDVDRDVQSFGFYLQDEYRPLASLAVTAGVRLDHYDTFGNTVNPRLACVFRPVDSTTLKALYGNAFRAPNVGEFYYEDGGQTSKTNPNLKREKISTYEIVCERQLGRHWRGSIAGFQSTVQDLINSAQDPADSLYFFENLGQVETRGLEIQVEAQLAPQVRGRASYTLAQAENQASGAVLDNSPEHLAKFNLTVPVFLDWLVAGAEAQYTSDRTTMAGQTLDDLWLLNATLLARQIRGRVDVSLGAYNLLDTRYSDPAFSPDTVEQDGRTLRLKLLASF